MHVKLSLTLLKDKEERMFVLSPEAQYALIPVCNRTNIEYAGTTQEYALWHVPILAYDYVWRKTPRLFTLYLLRTC